MTAPATALAGIDARILRLALPTLGAYLAEPLFQATESALVGHLGTAPLASLSVGNAVIGTVVGLLVFLAYATTPIVGRRFGEGDRRGAAQAGVDGLWIALGLGLVLLAVIAPLAGPIVRGFGAEPAVASDAAAFLAVAAVGVPGMLLVTAATGYLRGTQDVRTPLLVAVAGFAANALLDWCCIYPLGLGVVGAALGTVVAQWAMAAALVAVVLRRARRASAALRPGRTGILGTLRLGGWVLLRTVSLRILFLAMPLAAIAHGTATAAAVQITANTVLGLLAFALDALAIAGQALIAESLGRGDRAEARAVFRRLLRLAVVAGLGLGAVVAACCVPIARIFTTDPALVDLIWPGILVVAVGIPIGGAVYVLDGVLMGAGDARFLALAGLVNLAITGPALLWIALAPMPALAAVVLIQAVWSVLSMLARAIPLGLRSRGDAWLAVRV